MNFSQSRKDLECLFVFSTVRNVVSGCILPHLCIASVILNSTLREAGTVHVYVGVSVPARPSSGLQREKSVIDSSPNRKLALPRAVREVRAVLLLAGLCLCR